MAVLFCLLTLFTRERVGEFLARNLILYYIFFELIPDILLNNPLILSGCIAEVSSRPEMSIPVLVAARSERIV